jgi:lipoprotein-releasing system ATP-binding protein
MADSVLDVRGVTKQFRTGQNRLDVLKGIDLTVGVEEIVAIVGPSGAGKSTLLHIVGGLERPTSGTVLLDGTDLFTVSEEERARLRNRSIGFIFQFHHLLKDFTALENVMMPLLIRGEKQGDAARAASDLLARVGLSERLDHLPSELSGGESQRVAAARAMVTDPRIILADEPSGNLDSERSGQIHDLLWDLARENGQACIIVTHDRALSDRADRVIVMSDGRAESGQTPAVN